MVRVADRVELGREMWAGDIQPSGMWTELWQQGGEGRFRPTIRGKHWR